MHAHRGTPHPTLTPTCPTPFRTAHTPDRPTLVTHHYTLVPTFALVDAWFLPRCADVDAHVLTFLYRTYYLYTHTFTIYHTTHTHCYHTTHLPPHYRTPTYTLHGWMTAHATLHRTHNVPHPDVYYHLLTRAPPHTARVGRRLRTGLRFFVGRTVGSLHGSGTHYRHGLLDCLYHTTPHICWVCSPHVLHYRTVYLGWTTAAVVCGSGTYLSPHLSAPPGSAHTAPSQHAPAYHAHTALRRWTPTSRYRTHIPALTTCLPCLRLYRSRTQHAMLARCGFYERYAYQDCRAATRYTATFAGLPRGRARRTLPFCATLARAFRTTHRSHIAAL